MVINPAENNESVPDNDTWHHLLEHSSHKIEHDHHNTEQPETDRHINDHQTAESKHDTPATKTNNIETNVSEHEHKADELKRQTNATVAGDVPVASSRFKVGENVECWAYLIKKFPPSFLQLKQLECYDNADIPERTYLEGLVKLFLFLVFVILS